MEKFLKKLFDFQKFAQNKRLSTMLEDAEKSNKAKLDIDDLASVSAAGSPDSFFEHKKKDPFQS